MNMLKYIEVDNDIYSLDLRVLHESSMLYYMLNDESSIPVKKKHVNYEGNNIEIPYITSDTNIDLRCFKDVIVYLNTGKVNIEVDKIELFIHLLDFFGIFTMKTTDYPIEFIIIKLEEEWDRLNRYNPYFEDVFDDPYLNLIDITDEVQSISRRSDLINLGLSCLNRHSDNKEFKDTFSEARNLINSVEKKYGSSVISRLGMSKSYYTAAGTNEQVLQWIEADVSNIISSYFIYYRNRTELYRLFWDGHVVVAGSSIISIMKQDYDEWNNYEGDMDFFFIGLSSQQIQQRIIDMLRYIEDKHVITRSANAISIGNLHLILRAYKNISELLHSFDIDVSCIAYDGSDVYITNRCKYALDNMVNIVDFDRMSPSYEYRLLKYMKDYYSIYIPDFTIHRVNWNKISLMNTFDKDNLRGLDYILFHSLSRGKIEEITDHNGNKLLFYDARTTPDWMKRKGIIDITFNTFNSLDAKEIIHIPHDVYTKISIDISQHVTIKTTDQLTNKSHATVTDISNWYKGDFYIIKED